MPRASELIRIQVVAGILRGDDGRVLLAERKKDPIFNGLWEFPGGKSDAPETPEETLRRELAEELGVEIAQFERLLGVAHDYPDRLVHLDFFLVTAWRGTVRPLDGQALKWVLPAEIEESEVLPADVAVIDLLKSL